MLLGRNIFNFSPIKNTENPVGVHLIGPYRKEFYGTEEGHMLGFLSALGTQLFSGPTLVTNSRFLIY